MFIQQAPADTFDFMVYGFAVILGVMGLFIGSLALRFRRLRQDLAFLEELESEG